MGEEKKYLFGQYASGRKTEGGYSSQSSETATRIPSQLFNSTRAAQVTNELPTRELQSYQMENAASGERFTTFTLNHSIHVTNRYEKDQNGTIQLTGKTRDYDFTQNILLQGDVNPGWEDDRVAALLEMLTCESFFWTPYDYQEQGKNDKLEDLEVSIGELHRAWYQLTQQEKGHARFSNDNLAAFLARFWEVCFERQTREEAEHPLIVVATSPERNAETYGEAVLKDGVRFFHDQVLPCLPEALQRIVSVSFGCIGLQQRAQKGTACMFCYPENETLNMEVLYSPYNDKVFDDTLDAVVIRIGEDLRTGNMLDAFTKLCSLPGGQECAQDFPLYYEETKLNMLIDNCAVAKDPEKRIELEESCMDSLEAIRGALDKYGLSPDEITWVLFSLENKWRKVCAKTTASTGDRMVQSWARDYISLNNRDTKLTEEEKKELTEQFEKYRSFLETYGFLSRTIGLINEKKMYEGRNGEPAADLLFDLFSYDKAKLNDYIQKREKAKKEETAEIDAQCLEGLESLRNHLKEYGFSPEETTQILLLYELKFREICQGTSSTMIQIWTRDELDRESRSATLNDTEKQQLADAYRDSDILKGQYHIISDTIARIREEEKLRGDDNTLAEELISKLYPIETAIAEALARQKNSRTPEEQAAYEAETDQWIHEAQTMLLDYGFSENDSMKILRLAVLDWVTECGKKTGFHQENVIEDIVRIFIRSSDEETEREENRYLCELCIKALEQDRNELRAINTLLNTCAQEQQLQEEPKNELIRLIRRMVVGYAEKTRVSNEDQPDTAFEKIKDQIDEIAEKVQRAPFFLPSAQVVPLLAPMEILIPQWAVRNGRYEDKMYRYLLDKATRKELTDSSDVQWSPNEASIVEELRNAYAEALAFDYSDLSTDDNPLKAIIDSGISPEKLDACEPAVCENMLNHPEVEIDADQLILRMIAQAECNREDVADSYHQILLRQSGREETETFLKFINLSSGNTNQSNFQNKPWLRKEALRLLTSSIDADELLSEEQLSGIAAWNEKTLPQEDDLTERINEQFYLLLTDKLRDDESVVSLIDHYGKSRTLRDNGKDHFTSELVQRMNTFELEQIAQSSSLLDAVEAYRKIDPSINQRINEILINCIETRNHSVGVTTGDISLIIQASGVYGIQDEAVKNAISIVLKNCEGAAFDPETLTALREYLRNHIFQSQQKETRQDPIISSMREWLLQPEDVYVHTQKKMTDFIDVLNDYVRAQSDRIDAVQEMTQDILPRLPEDEMPETALINSLVPYAGDGRGAAIRENLVKWYDRISVEEPLYPMMDELIQVAKIRPENRELFEKYPKWTRYFLDRQTEKLIGMIQEQPLKEVIGYADQGDKAVREFNRLYAETSGHEDGKKYAQKQREKLEGVLINAVEEEARTQSNSAVKALAQVNNSLVRVNEQNIFAACVKEAVLEYFNNLSQNDQQFKAALRDRDAILALGNAFRQNQIQVDNEEAELKKQAVSLAGDIVTFYDKCSKHGSVEEEDMKEILEKIENQQTAYSLISDVCFNEGCQSLGDEKTLLRDLPRIISYFQKTEQDEWNFDWMNFLNNVHGRSNGAMWESASILTDEDNTYGTLAAILQWMNDSHLTKTQQSFEKFLSSSSIGRTAKVSMKKILKHMDKQSGNPMLNWLKALH